MTVENSTTSKFDVDELMKQLTIDEKFKLIAAADFYHTAPIERLGIPAYRVSDGPNGVRGTLMFDGVPSACFPNGTGLAASFNKELLKECGELMSREAIHKGAQVILGPTTNIQRGPIGGRGFESYSEDPYLAGMVTASIVSGIQKSGKVAATVKHFICNDLEDERFSSNSIVSERALREIYLEPFRWTVKLADPKCIMTSYNRVNGIHCSESPHLLKDILRDEWHWPGMTMSDYYGTYSTVNAIRNGLDAEFPGPTRFRKPEIVKHVIFSKEENLAESEIDNHVRHSLGLIKYLVDGNGGVAKFDWTQDDKNNTPETSAILRKAATDGIVLLKNETSLLPLSKTDDIVVIGPNAKSHDIFSGGGSARLNLYYGITPFEGIENKVGHEVPYTYGCFNNKTISGLFENMTNTWKPEVPGTKASFYLHSALERAKTPEEPFEVRTVNNSLMLLNDYQNPAIDLECKLFYIDFEGYYTPDQTGEYEFATQVYGTITLFLDGKPLVENVYHQVQGDFCYGSGTIEVTAKTQLEAGRKYKITVEYGSGPTSELARDASAGGLQVGVRQVIPPDVEVQHAAELAKAHDKVILCIGLNNEWECEASDRPDMKMPNNTDDLVRAVLKENPNTVIVNHSGTPVEMPWVNECNTLVQAWFGGNETGNAIADVLFGDTVPSGKLPLSWPIKNEDNPAFLNFHTERGRVLYGEDIFVGYRFYEKLHRKVAFPFGYGLSYTTFQFSNLSVSEDGHNVSVSFKVANSGDTYTGEEVAQVYISQVSPSITRPVKELKEFAKVKLQPGQSEVINLTIPLKYACSFFDEYENKWCLEAGTYKVLVGNSSDSIHLKGEFAVKETTFWTGL